jgi:hypothetical protein
MSTAKLRAFVLLVDLGAVALLAGLVTRGGERPTATALTLVGLAAVAGAFPVRLPSLRVNLKPSDPFVLCALAALGPVTASLAVIAAVLGAALGRRRWPLPIHLAFNLGAFVLSVGAASGAFYALGGRPGAEIAALIPSLAAAAVAYFFTNTLLVAVAIGLEKQQPVLPTWRRSCLWTGLPFFTGVLAAVALLGLLEVLVPWGVVLSLPVCWLMIQNFREHRRRKQGLQV